MAKPIFWVKRACVYYKRRAGWRNNDIKALTPPKKFDLFKF
jgi:hypothetical protein